MHSLGGPLPRPSSPPPWVPLPGVSPRPLRGLPAVPTLTPHGSTGLSGEPVAPQAAGAPCGVPSRPPVPGALTARRQPHQPRRVQKFHIRRLLSLLSRLSAPVKRADLCERPVALRSAPVGPMAHAPAQRTGRPVRPPHLAAAGKTGQNHRPDPRDRGSFLHQGPEAEQSGQCVGRGSVRAPGPPAPLQGSHPRAPAPSCSLRVRPAGTRGQQVARLLRLSVWSCDRHRDLALLL